MVMRFDSFRDLDDLNEQFRKSRRTGCMPMDPYRIDVRSSGRRAAVDTARQT